MTEEDERTQRIGLMLLGKRETEKEPTEEHVTNGEREVDNSTRF